VSVDSSDRTFAFVRRIFGDGLRHETGFGSLNFPRGFVTIVANVEVRIFHPCMHASLEILNLMQSVMSEILEQSKVEIKKVHKEELRNL